MVKLIALIGHQLRLLLRDFLAEGFGLRIAQAVGLVQQGQRFCVVIALGQAVGPFQQRLAGLEQLLLGRVRLGVRRRRGLRRSLFRRLKRCDRDRDGFRLFGQAQVPNQQAGSSQLCRQHQYQ